MSSTKVATVQELRKFGLLLALLFVVFGELRPVFKLHTISIAPLVIAGVLFIAAICFPRGLKPVQTAWLKLGDVLGAINSRIIIGVLYWVGIVPIALVRRAQGIDKMNRKFDPGPVSYRVTRGQPIPKSEMERLF